MSKQGDDDFTHHHLIHEESNQHSIQEQDATAAAVAQAMADVDAAERPVTLVTIPEDRPAKITNKERAARLEQNRKAAKESRRRKKIMIEELQRSVVFFSRANSTLRQQSEDLSRLLLQAQAQVSAIESGQQQQQQQQQAAPQPSSVQQQHSSSTSTGTTMPTVSSYTTEQAQAHAVATQALFESQGFPPAAARAAAQTMNAGAAGPDPSSETRTGHDYFSDAQIQPGATMQAMANFQQAAAVAMQAAMGMNPVNKPPAMTTATSSYTPQYVIAGAIHHHHQAAATAVANPFLQWQPAPTATTTTQSQQQSQE